MNSRNDGYPGPATSPERMPRLPDGPGAGMPDPQSDPLSDDVCSSRVVVLIDGVFVMVHCDRGSHTEGTRHRFSVMWAVEDQQRDMDTKLTIKKEKH